MIAKPLRLDRYFKLDIEVLIFALVAIVCASYLAFTGHASPNEVDHVFVAVMAYAAGKMRKGGKNDGSK